MHAQGHVARRYASSLQEMASEKCSHWRTPARGEQAGGGGQCVKGAYNSRTGERESRVDPDLVFQSRRSKPSEEKTWQTCLTWPQKMNPMRDRFLLP